MEKSTNNVRYDESISALLELCSDYSKNKVRTILQELNEDSIRIAKQMIDGGLNYPCNAEMIIDELYHNLPEEQLIFKW